MKGSDKGDKHQLDKVITDVTIDPPTQPIGEESAQNKGDIPKAIPKESDKADIPS